MKKTYLFNKENLFIVFLLLFSLLINQYYGNRGVFPLDSFSHFDAGFRILLGEYPFKDYWAVSGPFIDFTGFVESINEDKQKVKVLVSIFGRPTPIELDFFQVELEK